MWTAYLVHFISGRVGPQVDVTEADWTISLNNAETANIGLKKHSLPQDAKIWLHPYWGGVLLCWNEIPVFVGPLISHPQESLKTIKIACGSIRNILAKRTVLPELADWNTIATQTISYKGLSLGTIAKRIVQDCQKKPGGSLPISFPVPDQTAVDDADHERNYRGFNIANLNVDHLLTNIANVSSGPDIMFRPRLVDASRFTLDMWTGTETQPRIAQDRIVVWDTTPEFGSVTNLEIVTTGAELTNRVYSTGAGQDEGTLIAMEENLSGIASGMPLLETVISTSDSENIEVVRAHAKGSLQANLDVLREITLTVRADGVNRLGTFWPGDLVRIVTKDWVTLDDGVYDCRVLTMTGGTTNDIRLSMQTEVQYAS